MQKSQPLTSRISATSAANHIDCWSIPFLCGNTGSIARIFSGLEVRTRWGTDCVCEHPGSPQGADACGASGSSNCCQDVAAERAEDAGKWRIGSAGVAVCGRFSAHYGLIRTGTCVRNRSLHPLTRLLPTTLFLSGHCFSSESVNLRIHARFSAIRRSIVRNASSRQFTSRDQ